MLIHIPSPAPLFESTGGHDADGRLPSVWDITLRAQGLETGDQAVDSYHLWREDVRLLKEYGCNAYRFSVSWSRVKPMGGKDDEVNEKGIGYYNDLVSDPLLSCSFSHFCLRMDTAELWFFTSRPDLAYYRQIDALLEADITPYITLFHWDLPQPLQDRYKGFRAANKAAIVDDFVSYAELLFERFGDRVKNWITLNEVSLSVPISGE
jgi:beta-glucosidase